MAERLFPSQLQNPAPAAGSSGQVLDSEVSARVEVLLSEFLKTLPSNYVSQVKGPFYTLQFQAPLEALARIQLEAELLAEDLDYRFTRTEYLYQILGQLFFSDPPELDSDIDLREFYRRLFLIMLQGTTKGAVTEAAQLLTEANIVVRESGTNSVDIEISYAVETSVSNGHYHTMRIGSDGSGVTLKMFDASGTEITTTHSHTISEYAVNVSAGHTHEIRWQFAPDLFRLLSNLDKVIPLVKPAHVLHSYQNVFREILRVVKGDSLSLAIDTKYYEDARKNYYGLLQVTGTQGVVGTDRRLLVDATRDFSNVQTGATLTIGAKSYTIQEILPLPFLNDTTARPYITAPSGLSGSATVVEGYIVDAAQNFGLCASGETLQFLSGPNAGTYRLKYLFGTFGGIVGKSAGPATRVKPANCCLRTVSSIVDTGSSIFYKIFLDDRGVKTPVSVTLEDVSQQFL